MGRPYRALSVDCRVANSDAGHDFDESSDSSMMIPNIIVVCIIEMNGLLETTLLDQVRSVYFNITLCRSKEEQGRLLLLYGIPEHCKSLLRGGGWIPG